MAIGGVGIEYDVSGDISDGLKTTTSQYTCVTINDEAFYAPTGTASADVAIGVLQSYQSASSEVGTVRLFGVSKVKTKDAVTAGTLVKCSNSTTSYPGYCIAITTTAAGTTTSATVTSIMWALGYAMETGVTNQVIKVMVMPQALSRALYSPFCND